MKTLLLLGALTGGASGAPKLCEIAGEAIHWPYDSCMFLHETDDALHPGVVACADKAQKIMRAHGTCTAKRIFKDRICAARAGIEQPERSRNECMLDPEVKGPTVRNGGL
jgi:hypothetical protein